MSRRTTTHFSIKFSTSRVNPPPTIQAAILSLLRTGTTAFPYKVINRNGREISDEVFLTAQPTLHFIVPRSRVAVGTVSVVIELGKYANDDIHKRRLPLKDAA